ncbi:hypothetical protein Srot_2346 [Segniliparus rotundus DSM 44985]|uniref:Uncharacterized protein n=1 Tax=Segniliparus rotundus (strain ATCC BAA-972 / CDC 1076 / CIP 108378 / DSM 44985 / JCM 13578) TaxID=640132 RepID=D6ZAQ8_SEGRD|nr:hypothetical protein [Segniliparus rotundus]ADG98794.1 hypothetical protein Srot_2346 [Segniliparus rotundus DSM 44985]
MSEYLTPPSAGDWFRYGEHEGELLLVTPHEFREGAPSQWGDRDVVDCTVIAIDDAGRAEQYDDVEIDKKRLVKSLRKAIGKGSVLGRLAKGESKNGFPAPWILVDPTPADRELADKALTGSAKPSDDQPPW